MNEIMESIFRQNEPTIDVLKSRQDNPMPRLEQYKSLDAFSAYLYEDMRQCYQQGLDHAAIVTACALLEFSLKAGLYFYEDLKNNRVFNQVEWNRIDEHEFGPLISELKSKGYITKEGWKTLEKFRTSVRNDYMHGSTPKEIKTETISVFQGNYETGEASIVDIPLVSDLSLQRMQRVFKDREQCWQVVFFVRSVVVNLFKAMDSHLIAWEAQHAEVKPTKAQVDEMFKKMKELGFTPSMAIMRHLPEGIGEQTPDAEN